MATPIPPDIKKAVSFIFIKNDKGELAPNGTGFFVGIKSKKENSKAMFGYFVTAKHVLQRKNGSFYPEIYIRINTIDGKFKYALYPSNTGGIRIHQEADVDIAVIPFMPDVSVFDFKVIPEEILTTGELFTKENIVEGDEVFFVGLFTPHYGGQKNYPVTRFGRVALISDEKVRWGNELLDLYLVETQSYGGNSGAPVFFNLDLMRRKPGQLLLGAGNKLLLAGVMKGTFRDPSKVEFVSTDANTDLTPISLQNMGIAAVVPAQKLYDILFSPELIKFREEHEPSDLTQQVPEAKA